MPRSVTRVMRGPRWGQASIFGLDPTPTVASGARSGWVPAVPPVTTSPALVAPRPGTALMFRLGRNRSTPSSQRFSDRAPTDKAPDCSRFFRNVAKLYALTHFANLRILDRSGGRELWAMPSTEVVFYRDDEG